MLWRSGPGLAKRCTFLTPRPALERESARSADPGVRGAAMICSEHPGIRAHDAQAPVATSPHEQAPLACKDISALRPGLSSFTEGGLADVRGRSK